jgi:hypothetical protein
MSTFSIRYIPSIWGSPQGAPSKPRERACAAIDRFQWPEGFCFRDIAAPR